MIFTSWTAVIMFFTMLAWFTGRKARKYDRKYCKASDAAEAEMAKTDEAAVPHGGRPSERLNYAMSFSKAVKLGEERDRLEALYSKWAGRSKRMYAVKDWLKSWNGRKLPYTFGTLDTMSILYAIDRYGLAPYLTTEKATETMNLVLNFVKGTPAG